MEMEVKFRGLAAENVEKFPWDDVRRPHSATRVAASGCHFQNQITRLLRAQCKPPLTSKQGYELYADLTYH